MGNACSEETEVDITKWDMTRFEFKPAKKLTRFKMDSEILKISQSFNTKNYPKPSPTYPLKNNLQENQDFGDKIVSPSVGQKVENMNSLSLEAKRTLIEIPDYYPMSHSLVSNNKNEGPIFYFADSSTYKGHFKRGKRNGIGELVSKLGDFYQGIWEHDQLHGEGRAIYADGSYYQGNFYEGEFEKFGKLFDQETKSIYEGGFLSNEKSGQGKEIYKDGSIYKGGFFDGVKNGRGIFDFEDGSFFEGEFLNDFISGKGVYQTSNGDRYEGQFKKNYKHGKGRLVKANGIIYEGGFDLGKMNGFGKMSWQDGSFYEGGWLDGRQQGQGRFVDKKGNEEKGVWEYGIKFEKN